MRYLILVLIAVGSCFGQTLPTLPDSQLLNWNTTTAGTPSAGPNICVEKSSFVVPTGITCGTVYDTGAPLTDLQNAITNAACDQIIVLANIQYLGNINLPNGVNCSVGHWWQIVRDVTDPVFPPEGFRVDPCYAGIPQTAMLYYPYPKWHATPNTCARHMPQLICNLTSGNSCFGFNPGASTQAANFLRIIGLEITRAQNFDISLALFDLDYQPSTDCAVTGGSPSLPTNAVACMNDQPHHIICDRCLLHGDAQRQTVIGLKMAGVRWVALIDSYCYDIGVTFAGGGGDGHCYGWGTGHGYTNVGYGKFINDFVASSTMGSEFCGAYVEPNSPATGFDGIPTNLWWNQHFFWKNPLWDTEIGTTLGETLTLEGQTYGPAADQEFDITPTAIQLAVNQTFQFQTTWLNDSGSGINRMTDAGGGGSVTVDGVVNGNATVGTMSKVAEHNVGSGAWLSQNQITWSYTAPASAGTHTIVFNNILPDDIRLATLGNSRTLSATATVTVVGGTPTSQIAVSPNSPTLSLQPSYSDGFNNIRQFCITMFEFANYTPGAITWKVDGVTGGNGSVGTVTSSATGLASGESAYCSGTSLGAHTITATDGTVSGTSVVTVANSAPILGYDLKAYTSKNGWELKCGRQVLLENSLIEVAWGSQGNGGGQGGTAVLLQSLNQANQTFDGAGSSVGYGPETIVDVTLRNNKWAHVTYGFVTASLNQALGTHRVLFLNDVLDDMTWERWSNGFQKIGQTIQYSGTALTTVLSWTSLSTPNIDNVVMNHITAVQGTGGVTSLMSVVNNTAQFPTKFFSVTNSILASDGAQTFAENNGEAGDCNTSSGTGANNTEARTFAGATSGVACSSPYTFNFLALTNSTASPSVFTSSPIWQPTVTDVNLFRNYSNGYEGDYRVVAGGLYDAGSARQASDGLALGADITALNVAVNNAKNGVEVTAGPAPARGMFAQNLEKEKGITSEILDSKNCCFVHSAW